MTALSVMTASTTSCRPSLQAPPSLLTLGAAGILARRKRKR